LERVFDWVETIRPEQPYTSAVYNLDALSGPVARLQLERSEVISCHCYADLDALKEIIATLRVRVADRPLLCTEFLARARGSHFETHLPLLKEHNVGAMSWGLVAGKTQTQFDWDTWDEPFPKSEPPVWHHDIFRWDGSPFDREEIARIRSVTWSDAILKATVGLVETSAL
jgi:hypothetical protein